MLAQRSDPLGDENAVVVDLAASSLPVPTQPEPTPVQPPTETIDEDAVEPAPEKQPEIKPMEPVPAPKPVVKREPPVRPKPKPPAATRSVSSAPSTSSAPHQGENAGTRETVKGMPTGSPENESVTPAISGMQSLGNSPPDYPSVALRRRQEGSVTLRILVLENGRAGDVSVTKSSRSTYLDEAAIAAVKQWRFIPSKRGNVAIKGYAEQTITFTLPR
ncbi:energy transducer TonB [Serratia ficaria]|nr:energy transducer TonB [Serratia ficaria]